MHAFRALTDPPGSSRPALADRRLLPTAFVLDGVRRTSFLGWLGIDIALVAVAAGAGYAIAAMTEASLTPVLMGVFGVIIIAVMGVDFARTGRTFGHRMLGHRTVATATGFPPSIIAMFATTTVNIRRGRDPVRVAPIAGAAPVPEVDQWQLTASRALNAPVMLVLDDGMTMNIVGPTIIGRNPARSDEPAQLLQVPDLTRTMSKSHALLEPQGGMLWVTDLGSMNGTTITEGDAKPERLDPFARTVVRNGATVAFGDRVATVGPPEQGGI